VVTAFPKEGIPGAMQKNAHILKKGLRNRMQQSGIFLPLCSQYIFFHSRWRSISLRKISVCCDANVS
jgi:hypothetical protein